MSRLQLLGVSKARGSVVGELYSVTLNADGGGFNGYTIVNKFAASALMLPGGEISQVRVTFEAGAGEGLTITNAYIGHRAGSGDAYDFSATPVQLLWSGSGTKAISAGAQEVTDWASFAYDKTTDLLIAFYLNGGASVDTMRRKTGLGSGINSYYAAATNEAATVNKTTGYAADAGQNLAIAKIESDGF